MSRLSDAVPRIDHRRALGPLGLLDVILTSLGLMGCPGSLDPSLVGGTGSGGTSGGGTGGTASVNCTGTNDGATLITTNCAAVSGCHMPGGITGAGLDLTIDPTIGSRLVGVLSSGDTTHGSVCGGWSTPYLTPGAIPTPTGLLIDKISLKIGNAALCPGGSPMPYPGVVLLSATQQACIEQWAEGLIVAAGAQ
jgi:hypothetical protein